MSMESVRKKLLRMSKARRKLFEDSWPSGGTQDLSMTHIAGEAWGLAEAAELLAEEIRNERERMKIARDAAKRKRLRAERRRPIL